MFGPLNDMQPVEPRFTSWVPLAVEWPEDEAGDTTPGPDTDETAPVIDVETETTSMQTDLLENEIATPVLSSLNEPVITESGGVVWNIQTNLP